MHPTMYLNVDLDICSRRDLQPLVDAMGAAVSVNHLGRAGRGHVAYLELSGMTRPASPTIRAFARLIGKLPRDARSLWNGATKRVFNVGIQAGDDRATFTLPIDGAAVRAAESVGASVVVTVYGSGLAQAWARAEGGAIKPVKKAAGKAKSAAMPLARRGR